MSQKVYEIVTSKILEALDQGVVPWSKPWRDVALQAPRNLKSKHEYRGINWLVLNLAPYSSPWWISYRQAKERGGQVRKGEKGWPVVFCKPINRIVRDESGNEEEESHLLFRHYTAFNTDQIEGIQDQVPQDQIDGYSPIEVAENLIQGMPNPPVIHHGRNRACYAPGSDTITLPHPEQFEKVGEYYSALFHELGHSTGHPDRLDRPEIKDLKPFGHEDYSREELVAEITSAFLCARAGIKNTIEHSASYINHWKERLGDDPKLIVQAASRASKAADFILGLNRDQDRKQEGQEAV